MARKKSHDPGVNLYSDGDSDGELNNRKLSPGSSPSAKDVESAFVYNDLRKGGPQMNGGSKDSTNSGTAPDQHEAVATGTPTTTQPVTQAAAQTTTTTTQAAAATRSRSPSPCTSHPDYRATNCVRKPKVKYNGSRSGCDEADDHRFCENCTKQDRCPGCGKQVLPRNKSKPADKCRRQ
jgi:hypothetical protein